MKLTNMALAADEQKEYAMLCCDEGMHKYPYNLCITLGSDECDKLGITNSFSAGTIVTIQAMAIVESVTEAVEDDGDDKGNDITMRLQITDLGVEPQGTATDAASRLYAKPTNKE